MNKKLITTAGLFFILGFSLLIPSSITAQDSNQKPNYSAYYFHRLDHFRLMPNNTNEIIFLGDSITDGAEWTELTMNLNVKNRGISGDITEGILYRLDEVTESRPAKIFIMIGVNDLATGATIDKITENYFKIISFIKAQSPNTAIFIQSVLPVNDTYPGFKNHTNKTDQIIELNQRLLKMAGENGCTFIDLFTPFSADNKLKKELTEDGLHINGSGYLLWYSLIKKWL